MRPPEQDEIVLIPAGYRGPLLVLYVQPVAAAFEATALIHPLPASGVRRELAVDGGAFCNREVFERDVVVCPMPDPLDPRISAPRAALRVRGHVAPGSGREYRGVLAGPQPTPQMKKSGNTRGPRTTSFVAPAPCTQYHNVDITVVGR